MILKYVLLSLATLIFITSSDPYYGTLLTFKPLPKETSGDVREVPWRRTDAFDYYLEDRGDRVSDSFAITTYYEPNVRFWFFIYTQFSSNQVVFHDKNNLSLIYRVLDFSSLQAKKLPKNTLYILQQKITQEKIDLMREDLWFVVKNPFSLEQRAKNFYESIKRAGVTIPTQKEKRIKFFTSLAENVRSQTGQKNFIRDGVTRSQPYQKFLRKYFKAQNLPSELLAIPFLESSFNPDAQSKVNALGAWQFMPLIASYFVPKRTDSIDYRSNVGVASISAAFLMTENFKILKTWDLAVTAYNSGTKHLLKTRRELATSKIDLEEVIKHSDSGHFGFASKNFYSEFLALAHTLAYREEIFRSLHQHERNDVDEDLVFYLSKCSLRLDKVLNKEQLDNVDFHNHQLRNTSDSLPKGVIITSKSELPKAKFLKLSFDQIVHAKPIHWDRFLKNQSCSTR
ncbi:MAG TPA: transglycosylase SLT domain-containing protein [Bacteriovoracaceae bacterium]|nr:transglycosylase SLT domain-containing protein [Bacteriovoracaceae bacterium]